MRVGYERTSTKEQNLDRQTARLKKDHCEKIFSDQKSGKNTNREGLHDMLKFIRQGDIVEVVAIDRLGRNKDDDLRILRKIKAKGALVDLANFDMMTPPVKKKNETKNHYKQRQNTYSLINSILIQLLAYVAETERREIKERQRQGIAIAKRNGKYKGKKATYHLEDKDTKEALEQYFNRSKNGLSAVEIARIHKMSRAELYYLKDKWKTKYHRYQTELRTK